MRRHIGRLEEPRVYTEVSTVPDVTNIEAADARVADIFEVQGDAHGCVQTIEEQHSPVTIRKRPRQLLAIGPVALEPACRWEPRSQPSTRAGGPVNSHGHLTEWVLADRDGFFVGDEFVNARRWIEDVVL